MGDVLQCLMPGDAGRVGLLMQQFFTRYKHKNMLSWLLTGRVFQDRSREGGGSERADNPLRPSTNWAKGPLSFAGERKFRACNKIKIVSCHSVFTFLLQNEVAFY